MPQLMVCRWRGQGRVTVPVGAVLRWGHQARAGGAWAYIPVQLARVHPGDVELLYQGPGGESSKIIRPSDPRNKLWYDAAWATQYSRGLPLHNRGRRVTGIPAARRPAQRRTKRRAGAQAVRRRRLGVNPSGAWKRRAKMELRELRAALDRERVVVGRVPGGGRAAGAVERGDHALYRAGVGLRHPTPSEKVVTGHLADARAALDEAVRELYHARQAAGLGYRNPRKSSSRARRNPSAAAVRTFKKWHGFEPRKVSRVKGYRAPSELVLLGTIPEIIYRSNKWTGKQETYSHKTGKPQPMLATDPEGKGLYIVGGRVSVTERGLVG